MQSLNNHSINSNHNVPRRIKFCGRLDELNALRHAFDMASRDVGPIAYSVFVEGESGSGKSALIRTFHESLISNKERFLFCRGKFEEGAAAIEPLSTVLTTCKSMVNQLLTDDTSHTVWRERLSLELSEQDMAIVREAIPALRAVIPEPGRDIAQGMIDTTNDAWRFDRLRFALRSLVRTVSKYIPLVLFFDDLQWAGEDALMLLRAILVDKVPNRHLLVLGAYRPVRGDHPVVTQVLNQRVQRARFMRTSAGQNLTTDICLSDLSESDTLELVSSVLQMNDVQSIQSLNAVVFRKTRGNPFFVLQFLRLLEQRGYIWKAGSTLEWRSDLVYREAEIAKDVLGVVKDMIGCMNPAHQHVLTTLSCLGILQLNMDILVHIFRAYGNKESLGVEQHQRPLSLQAPESLDDTREKLVRALTAIASTGAIQCMSGVFKFGHDRMREGCYSLAPRETRQYMHLDIGRRLLRALPLKRLNVLEVTSANGESCLSDCDRDVLVHAVSQMNLGMALITDMDERRMLAALNYAVAEMAKSRSGFFPASQFLENGIRAICSDNVNSAWQSVYDLVLQLSIAKSRIDYCCGFWRSAVEHADTVIANAHSMEEKLPAYRTKALCLVQEGQSARAKELDLFVLGKLGVHFPRKVTLWHVVKEAIKTKKMLRQKTDHDLLHLPLTKDPNANLTCDFFLHLIEVSYLSVTDVYLVLLAFLFILQMSVTGGRFNLTGIGFVQYAAILTRQSRFPEAYRFGRIGLQIVENDGHYATKAKHLFHFFIGHWHFPLHESIAQISPLIRRTSYSEATRYCSYITLSFYAGSRLADLMNDILSNAEALEDHKDCIAFDHTAPMFQMASILTGNSPNQVHLTGQYMDEDEMLRDSANIGNIARVYLCKFFLSCFFANLPMAEVLLRKNLSWLKPRMKTMQPERPYWPFFTGMLAFLVARDRRDKGRHVNWYRTRGRASLREILRWQSDGMRTWSVMISILRAEDLALSCHPSSPASNAANVLRIYDEAISTIRDYSDYYLHLRGLANERAAVFCLEHNRLKQQASSYVCEAHLNYKEWGATAKVIQLEQMYPSFLQPGPHV